MKINMKNMLVKSKNIVKENLSLNILVLAMLVYFCVMSCITGMYWNALWLAATGILYIMGAALGGIRRYIPMALSVLSILVFLGAGAIFLAGRGIGIGFVAFGVVIIFYSITGFDSTCGVKCIPYCLAMFGAECVFCFNGDTRGMLVLVGALLLSVMFSNATYTAMSRYVFALFLVLAVLKLTGVWHVLRGTRPSGLIDSFIASPTLYIALAVLGIVSLLLRERHPRIKSDRDKKHVPAMKQWQAVIGFSLILLVFWGLSYIDTIYQMELDGLSDGMRMNLVYVASITALGDSVMTKILKSYGFFPLMFFTMMMISFLYKAYVNFRTTHLFADKLLLLMMAGFFVCFAYFDLCIPVMLLGGVLSGCVVNGSYKLKSNQGADVPGEKEGTKADTSSPK